MLRTLDIRVAFTRKNGSVAARNHIGGTAPDQVRKAIADARDRMAD